MAEQVSEDEVQFEVNGETITLRTDDIIESTSGTTEYNQIIDIDDPYIKYREVKQDEKGDWVPISKSKQDTLEVWEDAFDRRVMEIFTRKA